MHEVGIASAILEAGQAEAMRRNGAQLIRIGVRIGTLSGVDHEALRFALRALTIDTSLEHVTFDLQTCARRNQCLECGAEFESGTTSIPCPHCASTRLSLTGGEELDLMFIELEES